MKGSLARQGQNPRRRLASGLPDLAARVARLPQLGAVRQALVAEEVSQAWLGGGVLRDLACGIEIRRFDIDLAVPHTGDGVAKRLAQTLGGSPFPLDEAAGAWRVALPCGDTIDVVPLRAADIAGDLRGRDFTVNALALDLLGGRGVLDPLGGLTDLAAGQLRVCSPRSLGDDPLRVLRAYRFSAALGLAMAPGLAADLTRAGAALVRVAPERVRTELFALLGLPRGAQALRGMATDGVLAALFPFVSTWRGFDQGDYHAHDLWEHSLQTAEVAADLATDPRGLPRPTALAEHLAEELEAGVSRRGVLVCAALFHDLAKPHTVSLDGNRRRFLGHEVQGGQRLRRLLETLRVGKAVQRASQRIVAAHLRLFQLARQDPPTNRARSRFLQDLEDEAPEAVLLGLADELATGPAPPALAVVRRTAAEVLELFWQRREAPEREPLLRGRDVLEHVGVGEGPGVGHILRRVAEAEALGEVRTRDQALALAMKLADGLRHKGGEIDP
jgi:putative nucleotidyltransferase with HDIG domain